jgi:hypothetical protein
MELIDHRQKGSLRSVVKRMVRRRHGVVMIDQSQHISVGDDAPSTKDASAPDGNCEVKERHTCQA